jgi:hypothetical protein
MGVRSRSTRPDRRRRGTARPAHCRRAMVRWPTGVPASLWVTSGPTTVWSWITSLRRTARYTWTCRISGTVRPVSSARARSATQLRGTGQVLSPVVTSSTSCSAWPSPRASWSTNVSVPPYSGGGTGDHGGAINPTLMRTRSHRPVAAHPVNGWVLGSSNANVAVWSHAMKGTPGAREHTKTSRARPSEDGSISCQYFSVSSLWSSSSCLWSSSPC